MSKEIERARNLKEFLESKLEMLNKLDADSVISEAKNTFNEFTDDDKEYIEYHIEIIQNTDVISIKDGIKRWIEFCEMHITGKEVPSSDEYEKMHGHYQHWINRCNELSYNYRLIAETLKDYK